MPISSPAGESSEHTSAGQPTAEGSDVAGTPEQRRTTVVGDLVRGALIGTVETVPGVSGGTVALVVGIYTQLIESASHVVSAGRRLITGPERLVGMRHHLTAVRWKLVIPVLIGMALAVFTIAGPMADAVENHPEATRAAFFGMVLASIAVPLRMALHVPDAQGTGKGRTWSLRALSWRHLAAGLVAAGATFWLVSVPPAAVEATPVTIVPAAAVAVSALLLPGLSGSFLLLTFGLYEPTLRAVEERDLGYLALFAAGMVIGVIVLVKLLQWLLEHRHRITMVVLAGVMLGALRTLWPWQDEDRGLRAASGDLLPILGLAAAGFAVVTVLVILDARMVAKQERQGQGV
ncbi:DUF368 domain-containing protein [Nesterenkonia xinjiangensis]|uniref:Putative membrane protein n=1 Tax=Nesterenkonia xinjiangensis TaxID=225327 RepID=A0A7Z0GMR1_9MICC|nr:DUF368 domain-containing protein [Nesterenkonia xinjiangensis]NYJ78760.1 putative membrane protein [Nesterenkonia xinjiangensis]